MLIFHAYDEGRTHSSCAGAIRDVDTRVSKKKKRRKRRAVDTPVKEAFTSTGVTIHYGSSVKNKETGVIIQCCCYPHILHMK